VVFFCTPVIPGTETTNTRCPCAAHRVPPQLALGDKRRSRTSQGSIPMTSRSDIVWGISDPRHPWSNRPGGRCANGNTDSPFDHRTIVSLSAAWSFRSQKLLCRPCDPGAGGCCRQPGGVPMSPLRQRATVPRSGLRGLTSQHVMILRRSLMACSYCTVHQARPAYDEA